MSEAKTAEKTPELKKRFTLESPSITLILARRDLQSASLKRRDLRRENSRWNSNSGAGGAYSTGTVVTRVIQQAGEEDKDREVGRSGGLVRRREVRDWKGECGVLKAKSKCEVSRLRIGVERAIVYIHRGPSSL